MNIIKVRTKTKNYSIYLGSNCLRDINKVLSKEKIIFKKCLIIFDVGVKKKYLNSIKKSLIKKKCYVFNIKPSEKVKSFNKVKSILDFLLKNNFTRNDCIISLGGGVVGDMACFVSSIFKRGMKFINLPTTLLSQVDASIGGKSGVNHEIYGKNLIGTFYQPDLVVTDTEVLKNLNKRELICGYAEILKHSLINDRNFFHYLSKNHIKILKLEKPYITNAIIKSCKIKIKIVNKDEKESNLRRVLNLGHTFGHAYEAANGFKKKMNHGEGVLLGIKSSIIFSKKKGYLSNNEFLKINDHLNNLNINLKLKNFFSFSDIAKLISYMKNDKKNRSSKINLILLKRIGKPIVNYNFNSNTIISFFKKELSNI